MGKANSTISLAHAIKGLRPFDGRSPGDFRHWHKILAVAVGVSRRDIANLIKGHPRPTKATAGTGSSPEPSGTQATQIALAQETSACGSMLLLLARKPASLLLIVLKYKDDTRITGDGHKSMQELVSEHNKVTDEVVLEKMSKLVNSNMKHGDDPESDFMGMRARAL